MVISPIKRNTARGLTLTELIIVIAIIAIIYSIGMLSYTGAKQTVALSNAATMLYTDLKKQRQRTITVDDTCGIRITSDGYVCYEGDPFTGTIKSPVDLTRMLGIEVKITQPSANSVIEFKPDIPQTGSWASLGSSSNIIVIKCGTQSKTITVSTEGKISMD